MLNYFRIVCNTSGALQTLSTEGYVCTEGPLRTLQCLWTVLTDVHVQSCVVTLLYFSDSNSNPGGSHEVATGWRFWIRFTFFILKKYLKRYKKLTRYFSKIKKKVNSHRKLEIKLLVNKYISKMNISHVFHDILCILRQDIQILEWDGPKIFFSSFHPQKLQAWRAHTIVFYIMK